MTRRSPATIKKRRKWQPASPALIASFEALVATFVGAKQRSTFGYPGAYVNDRLFAGLFEDSVVLKLPADARRELLTLPGAAPFAPIPGRAMGDFITLAAPLLEDRVRLRGWIENAYAYVATLPPKPSWTVRGPEGAANRRRLTNRQARTSKGGRSR